MHAQRTEFYGCSAFRYYDIKRWFFDSKTKNLLRNLQVSWHHLFTYFQTIRTDSFVPRLSRLMLQNFARTIELRNGC